MMDFYIKYEDIRIAHRQIAYYMNGWNENISNINDAVIEMIANPAMESETARNIYSYMYDVHLSIAIMVSHIISDFKYRQILYEAGMYEIDSYELSKIPSIEIEDLI
ncbi:MAG: hypothetical protein IJ053_04875, partial [Lachnospiraceae bacterium]|nr:hypothetical protein [Lachnospiraceae bacterium]